MIDGLPDPRTPSEAIQKLYPWLSKAEQLEVQDRLDRYATLAKRIKDDMLSRRCGRAGLELRLEDAWKEELPGRTGKSPSSDRAV